jgi:hypothetical protein
MPLVKTAYSFWLNHKPPQQTASSIVRMSNFID